MGRTLLRLEPTGAIPGLTTHLAGEVPGHCASGHKRFWQCCHLRFPSSPDRTARVWDVKKGTVKGAAAGVPTAESQPSQLLQHFPERKQKSQSRSPPLASSSRYPLCATRTEGDSRPTTGVFPTYLVNFSPAQSLRVSRALSKRYQPGRWESRKREGKGCVLTCRTPTPPPAWPGWPHSAGSSPRCPQCWCSGCPSWMEEPWTCPAPTSRAPAD